MNENAFDVGSGRRAAVKGRVVTVVKLAAAICMMQVDDDVGRIEKRDQMLCEISHRIHLEVGVAQQDGAGLGDREGGAHDREIDVRQVCGLMTEGE